MTTAKDHLTIDDTRAILLEKLDSLRKDVDGPGLEPLYGQLSKMTSSQLIDKQDDFDDIGDRFGSLVCGVLIDAMPEAD